MGMTKKAREYQEKMGTDMLSALLETDPEFAERFADFAYDEVVNQDDLDDGTRMMAVLAALLGCQGAEAFREMVPAALNMGVTPVQLKEIVYQAVAYLGIGRVLPFLSIVNEILSSGGIRLPLEGQAETTMDDRLEKGNQVQVDIFGEHMKEFWKTGRRNPRISTAGWPITASGIIIPGTAWITAGEK